MNRRDLLQSLALLPALAPLVKLEESPTKPPTEEWFKDLNTHTNWKIKWCGWHQLPAQHALFGYWWARNEELKLQVASPCPGKIHWMYDHQHMDLSIQEGQTLVTPETSVPVAEEQQKKALDNLIHFLKTEKLPF